MDGEVAFTSEAHIIPKDPDNFGCEWEVDWEWLYGKLEPGDYRICQSVAEWRGVGDMDTYPIRVYFHYAGEEEK